jgi:non-specific serine/threonine protein kinase
MLANREVRPVLVIHALWRPDAALSVWAEDPSLPPVRSLKGGRHPFAAPADALIEAVGPGRLDITPEEQAVTVRLPTRAGVPEDSPELLREEPPERVRGAVALADWSVPALSVDADDAGEVLRQLTQATQATLGASGRQLAAVADFAEDLVVRGRVVPSLDPVRSTAMWRPVLTGPDALWAQALALALPPAAWATATSAAQVVTAALDALVDSAVRARLPEPTEEPADVGPVWRRWLDALRGPDRHVPASPQELAELADGLAVWQRDAVAGPVRACFRLVEPAEPDLLEENPSPDWQLEFSLQATDEPSLVVGAEKVWASKRALKALARYLDAPQETLLRELGRASRLYPALNDALRTAKPSMLTLDAEGAHAFLRQGAPMLAAAGFGVMLPGWWSRPRARLGVRLTAGRPTAPGTVAAKSALGLDSLVDYQWELAIGDEKLTAAEMKRLSTLKAPLVRLRGQWVELDAKRLAAGLKLLSAGGQMTVGELLHTGLSTSDGPAGLPVVSVTAEGQLGELLAGQAERRLEPIPTPAGFTGTLRPYQERGLAWLAFLESLGLGPILADSMGLGKTIQLLALLQRDHEGEAEVGPTLLICPMSLVGNWQREAGKFAPELRVHVHHGAERSRGKAFADAVAKAELVVTTYALAGRDAKDLAEIGWHRIVVDEAQAIKNAATKQAVAVRSLPARHRIAVTGTPVENRLADLWSIMEFANPGLLGSALVFKSRFAEPIERRGDEAAAERLKRLTGPFILRREKTDKSIISDLPEKIEMEVVCNLTAEQASLYQAVVTDMLDKIEQSEGIERRGLVLATMTKLKQVCNHPAQLLRDGSRLSGRSGKLERLDEILDEVLENDERALLFTQYAEFGAMLRSHLSARFGREVAFLHGGVPKAERDAMVARFQADSPAAPALFVLSLKAGGTGLTLTAANHVVHVDRWWNPAVEDQATDRAFRIGQTRNVQVRKFVCAGTVEEKISEMIRDKRGLAARIVGSGEGWVTGLSTSELRDLFTLESGAVVE